MQIVWPATEKF